mgnify:FL=1
MSKKIRLNAAINLDQTLLPISIVIGIVRNEAGQFFISRRDETTHQGGFWEFAGGKVEHGETLHAALARELKEEIAIEMRHAMPLISFRHAYADRVVHLHVFSVTDYTGEATSRTGQESAWVSLQELSGYTFPAANHVILKALHLPPYYAILDDSAGDLDGQLAHLLAQNITLIQARLKKSTTQQAHDFLHKAYPLCRAAGVTLLINSSIENAFDLPCDGVHLTRIDLLEHHLRPKNVKWLSASCHNQLELEHAQKIGVDFAVLSPVWETASHPQAKTLEWVGFSELARFYAMPIYALGGLKKSHLTTAYYAGAQGICGISTFLAT